MQRFLAKLGIKGAVAAMMMIVAGVLVWIFPDLLPKVLAIYLIVAGIVKLLPE